MLHLTMSDMADKFPSRCLSAFFLNFFSTHTVENDEWLINMVNVLWMIEVCCLCEKCLFDSQTVNERVWFREY